MNNTFRKVRRLTCLLLALVTLLMLFPMPASAVGEELQMQTKTFDNDDLPSNDELFAGYVQEAFYGESQIGLYADYGNEKLTGLDLAVYNALKKKFALVANGTLTSTEFIFTYSDFGVTQSEWINHDWNAALNNIFEYILVDCPYELYWFDKTRGMVWGYSDTYLVVVFCVAKDYSADNQVETTTTDAGKTSAASRAVTNAQKIVRKYQTASDLEKLTGYRKEICDLVSYDMAAIDPSNQVEYGDPWQLISVFDGDPSTNVVCEGYSKAFQYLCDATRFDSDQITSYLVTGDMSGGAHMWNLVRMDDGKSYLVDVTNCDTGTIGAEDKLFLAYDRNYGSPENGYLFYFTTTDVLYAYDSDTMALYDRRILTLSTSPYALPPLAITQKPDTVAYGDVFTLSTNSVGGVTWSVTEGSAYATVDANGTVRVTGVGRVTITATKDGETASYTFTSTKAVPSYVLPSGLHLHIGGTLEEMTLPSGWVWVNSSETASEAGEQSFAAVYTPADTAHYQVITRMVPVTVENHIGVLQNVKEATEEEEGYSGDMICSVCNAILHTGTVIPKLSDCCDGGEDCPAHDFADVNPSKWYHESVDYAIAHGIMNGYDDGSFQPETSLTRAMLAQILYNLEGRPAVAYQSRFTDVSKWAWYKDAVNWAAENGIVNGFQDGTFQPEGNVTREQMATMLYRYAAFKGYDTTARIELSHFSDAASIQAYAQIPMQWSAAVTLLQGMGDGTISPKSNATRAQVATILMRYCESVAEK